MRKNLKRATIYTAIATLAFSAHIQSAPIVEGRILPMEQGLWDFEGDQFECKMTLPVPGIGDLAISKAAGSRLNLSFSPFEKKDRKVSVAWSYAPWNEPSQGRFMNLQDEVTFYRLDSGSTESLMGAMDEGGWLLFIDGAQTYKAPSLGWSIHASNFRECKSNLLTFSIDQIRDQSIFFESGQRSLSLENLQKIREIVRTIKKDESVRKILVDGYTDNVGPQIANLQLSRERSSDVVAALVAAGIDFDLIEQRSHGERYPSAKNDTESGRKFSRRVTIRVIRDHSQ